MPRLGRIGYDVDHSDQHMKFRIPGNVVLSRSIIAVQNSEHSPGAAYIVDEYNEQGVPSKRQCIHQSDSHNVFGVDNRVPVTLRTARGISVKRERVCEPDSESTSEPELQVPLGIVSLAKGVGSFVGDIVKPACSLSNTGEWPSASIGAEFQQNTDGFRSRVFGSKAFPDPISIDEWWEAESRHSLTRLRFSTESVFNKEPSRITKIVRKANETLTHSSKDGPCNRIHQGVPEKVGSAVLGKLELTGGFSQERYRIVAKNMDLEVCFGNEGLSRRTSMKFIIIRAPSPYNVILGRPGLKILHAIPSTIHSMIKFPTPKGIATLIARTITIAECRKREEKQMVKEETPQEEEGVDVTEQIIVNPSFPDQMVTIGGRLSKGCKEQLTTLLTSNMEVFAWEPADMTGVPRKVIEHALNVNPSLDPTAKSRRSGGFQVQVLLGCLQRVSSNPNGKGGRGKDSFLHGAGNVLLYEDAVRSKERRGHLSKAGRLDLPKPDRKKLGGQYGIRANPKKTKAISDLQSPKTLKEMQSLSGKLASLNRFLAKSAERALPFFNTLKNITKENKHEFRWTTEAEEAFQQMKKLIIRNGRQCPVQYVSRTLNEAERNYSPLEKLALSLVNMTRRLRRYFEAHPVKVITDQPIRNILSRTEVSGKLAKYAVEIGTYKISFIPRNAVKGQVLADFLSDAPDGEREDEYFQSPEVPPEIDDTETWTLYTDGAASSKGSGAGLILTDVRPLMQINVILREISHGILRNAMGSLDFSEEANETRRLLLAPPCCRLKSKVEQVLTYAMSVYTPRTDISENIHDLHHGPCGLSNQWGLDRLGPLTPGQEELIRSRGY
ncbi:reverse transcriptase domain-containing protein [Tanacetum coccineum]